MENFIGFLEWVVHWFSKILTVVIKIIKVNIQIINAKNKKFDKISEVRNTPDKKILKSFKKNYSIALMIDQRVSEGIRCEFFGQPALTTTIPAQLFKKFGCKIVPVYVERVNGIFFKIKVIGPGQKAL